MMVSFLAIALPTVKIGVETAKTPEQFSTIVQVLILLTVLSIAPALLLMLTSFTRLVVVFSILRHAIGTQQTPPNQVLISLALFLTFFIMTPTFKAVYEQAFIPYLNKQIGDKEFLERAQKPFKDFMLRNTREKDLALFIKLRQEERPRTPDDVSFFTLVPAFMISELKTAFQIGFLLYIPFLVIDVVISSVLISMGVLMLPPMMISLPIKLLLFVLVDGWNLLVMSLVKSFH
ncbi:MAG: Flagellar biosynthetic protein FliP [Thermodesulfobacterium sp. 37_54]|jgi:flagellar biosynthetic protein FliP|uniref:Flagellar biosynthetic protein FliP n=1 Tax=Thermodesulfobacterium commune DSM 2178 TaxID=289377 RepID=A0A075WTR3_9BACT|nr:MULTISPECIES: flagellar type III secretion system pore protein FliP [Thermodesulfobacterium]KUJ97163.1 MAG: Flagellar biosynthetic protein FliP [Thermodesulfobacterium sp. 37_54]KUK37576.1 MAG: Flagellar biosynthetic protein FliP [Thermodesulfobacterium commune]AIH03778.1 flagellar biosynthesis protein flip [Thermodesulfobacterium commune DSM 2178]MDK2861901.1 flagellar biosynthesis protein FliP [Thermodesulfobacterium sp.]MDN5379646.1 flagellar biosynthesis protein FliP [Thermodesulfobacte